MQVTMEITHPIPKKGTNAMLRNANCIWTFWDNYQKKFHMLVEMIFDFV